MKQGADEYQQRSVAIDARQKLIAEIYEVALRPELYDSFIGLWEKQLNDAIGHLKSLDEHTDAGNATKDPELEDHFQRAYMILEQMGRNRPKERTAEAFVHGEASSALVFQASGETIAANTPAQSLFGAVRNLRQLESFISPEDMRQLEMLQLRVDRPQSAPEVHVFPIYISRAGSNEPSQELYIARPLQLTARTHRNLAITGLLVNWNNGIDRILAKSFALTPSEISVVSDLASGLTVRQSAIEGGRSEHTVRTQLKNILSKTGCISQSELVRTVAMMSKYTSDRTVNVSMQERLSSGVRHDLALPDGRVMPVNEIGPSDGEPILFLHGMLDGFAFGRGLFQKLEDRRIRLLAPTRPGFGDAAATENRKSAPVSFAADLARLLDHFGVDTCSIMGHMAGSVYAFCAAGLHPDRFKRVFAVSGGVPIVSLKQFSAMAPRQKVVALTARFTPGLLPTILRAGIAQIDSGGEGAFMEALFEAGSMDAESIKMPEVRAAVADGYRFAVAQGHRAFEVDSYHVTRDWSDYPNSVEQPVVLIHGLHDPVVDIHSVRKFSERYENTSLIEVEDAGQLVMFQQPGTVFDALRMKNR